MKYIIDFKLFEAKQVGLLYHFCEYNIFERIIKSNFQFSSNYSGHSGIPTISMTRMNSGKFMPLNGRTVRFTFDGNKLSEKYPIQPKIDHKRGYGRKEFDSDKDESEEILITKSSKAGYGEMIDMKPYIIRIDIIYNKFIFTSGFDYVEEFDKLSKLNIPIFIKYNTMESKHELQIVQKNKSKYIELSKALQNEKSNLILLPENKNTFDQFKINTLVLDSNTIIKQDDYTFLEEFETKSVATTYNYHYAKKFKTLEELANIYCKYKHINNYYKYDWNVMYYKNTYCLYKL